MFLCILKYILPVYISSFFIKEVCNLLTKIVFWQNKLFDYIINLKYSYDF